MYYVPPKSTTKTKIKTGKQDNSPGSVTISTGIYKDCLELTFTELQEVKIITTSKDRINGFKNFMIKWI